MVESAIFFMVGFLSATFVALLAAPAVARRAARLANARARLMTPLSEAQARAERDALRAVQAVEIVRMERKVASAEWDRAMARVDLARETDRVRKLDLLAKDLRETVSEQDGRIAGLEQDLKAAEGESGAREIALRDLAGQRETAQRLLSEARARIQDLEVRIDRDRVRIATLSTQVSALELELADARARRRSFAGVEALNLEEQLRSSEAARADQTLVIARLMRAAAEREAAIEKAVAAGAGLAENLADRERRARAVEAELRKELQALTTGKAAQDGALATERESRRELHREIEALKARLSEEASASEALAKSDAALRLAIAKLGRDLVRTRQVQDDEPHGAAQIVNFARREPMA